MIWSIDYADDRARALLFERDGTCVRVVSTGGGLVEYETQDGRRVTDDVGCLVHAHKLESIEAVIRALDTHTFNYPCQAEQGRFQGGRMLVRVQARTRRDRLGRKVGHDYRVFILDSRGRLSKLCYKRGGKVTHLAQVSRADAVRLARGDAVIRYTRGTSRYHVGDA